MKLKFIAPLFVLFLLGMISTIHAQVEGEPSSGPEEELIAEEAQLEKWNRVFQDAEATFNSVDQPQSVEKFQALIAEITAEKMKRPLTLVEKNLLYRSLDYLAQAFFLDGQTEQSRSVYLKLIELDPNYRLNADLVSSKIIEFVDQIRNDNLAELTVTTDPSGAQVKLDGIEVGMTDLQSFFCMKGTHEVEVIRPGYHSQKKTVEVRAGRKERISFSLERSSSVAYFVTYPKGVEVYVNGNRIGITGGDPASRAEPVALEQNIPLAEFSGDFAVPDLTPGEYQVEFRKPCWETPTRKIVIEKDDDYLFTPIILSPSNSYLNILANDPNASIFIDDEYQGVAPKQNIQVCSGTHSVKLKGILGKYEREVDLKKDETITISATLNTTLAFLGISTPSGKSSANGEKFRKATVQKLSSLKTLNFQDNTVGDTLAQQDMVQQIISTMGSNEPDEVRAARLKEMCSRVEADLLLIGVLPQEGSADTVRFYLFSNWSSVPDIRTVKIDDSSQWNTFMNQLEYEFPMFEKRIGAILMDTDITEGPVVGNIPIKTFDDAEPLKTGDVVLAINDHSVKTAAELLARTTELQGPEQVTLQVQRFAVQFSIPIRMVRSAQEIRMNDASILYNRQIASFKKILNLSVDPVEKGIANLNTAICYMHFNEFVLALEQLEQAQFTRNTGIGPGTVAYRMAQCYKEINRVQELKTSLDKASRAGKNTILSDDGLPINNIIERFQETLR